MQPYVATFVGSGGRAPRWLNVGNRKEHRVGGGWAEWVLCMPAHATGCTRRARARFVVQGESYAGRRALSNPVVVGKS